MVEDVLFPPEALRRTAARMEDSTLEESMICSWVSACGSARSIISALTYR